MKYLELIRDQPLTWGLFLAYMLLTSGLAWMGHKKTTDIKSFAVGSGDIHPAIVGVTLAASIASTATFVINPGFVYVHGVSALMHLGVAAGLGVVAGLIVMSKGFRQEGERSGALTLPAWVGNRYGSRALRITFALVSLLSLSFVVLIIGGLSIVMQTTLGLNNTESLLLIVGFVFSYVFIGGTWAHAYTNTLQGIIMLGVALVIVGSGLPYLFGDGMTVLAAKDPNLVAMINPDSALFDSFFSVWISGFIIGFALVSQPHIMTKALYVKSDKAVRQYLTVAILVSIGFSALLLVGLYAHLMDLPREAFVDPLTGVFRQDRVMAVYVAKSFGPVPLSIITVALMSAGMSTLDGLLVALSSIAGHDLYTELAPKRFVPDDEEARARVAHRVSQLVLVAMGVAAFLLALNPPKLLGIFGQLGVYGIVAASAVPILYGMMFPKLGKTAALGAALTGLGVHFALYLSGFAANPAVTATWGLIAAALVALPAALLSATGGDKPRPYSWSSGM
ncbi:sodium:solute symporter family protein [Endomicrobium sp. AH-315-J14]|nr:sodium:solute symporter family protein [Endomicrobium sp. AH-315-J14]